jgi:putative transposase
VYPTNLTNAQWRLLKPLICVEGKRGRQFKRDIRRVVNGILYVSHTGCQWRSLPREFGPWTRVWSQFRRWSRNGTWARLLAELHRVVRVKANRAEPTPSMVVVDTHLARGASNGGRTFHDRGGPYGATNGAKRAIAVDVTGLPLAARALPASLHENDTTAALLDELAERGQDKRLQLVIVDKGVTEPGATRLSRACGLEVRRVGHEKKPGTFVPLPLAWRVEVAHGRLLRQRRLARSFENTLESATGWLQVACLAAALDAIFSPALPRRGRVVAASTVHLVR